MIVKKPYAFLIKNFRIIHGLLFIVLLYLVIRSINIYSFFSSYTSTGAFELRANMASSYVNFFMFGSCLIAIFLSFIIYYILSMKQKSSNMYLFIFIYYIALFIFFIYIHSVLNSILTTPLTREARGVLRDVCLMVLVPQIIFNFIILGRTFGFNLKQFDFKSDLEELEIDTSDNEEVEITLGNDTYKVKRFFRKMLRLTKYFVLENKMFVIGSACILILIILLNIYTSVNVYNINYSENEQILASSLWYKIQESYITNTDYNNNIINNNKYYLAVKVNIVNKLSKNISLDRETFSLKLQNKTVNPCFSVSDRFNDLGTFFVPGEIDSGEDDDYVVVFELTENDVKNEYVFRIKNFSDNAIGIIDTKYKEIVIKPKNLNNIISKDPVSLPGEFNLSDSILKNYTISVNDYDISDRFKENYMIRIDNKEVNTIYSIIPKTTTKGKISVLKLETSFSSIDESVYMSKNIKIPADLFDYYGLLNYRIQGENKITKLKKINVSYKNESSAYLEIPSEVKDANKIELILLIRGIKYTFNLK